MLNIIYRKETKHLKGEEKRKHGYVRVIYFSIINQNYESYKIIEVYIEVPKSPRSQKFRKIEILRLDHCP